MWISEYWRQVIQWCETHGFSVGLVGSSPKVQQSIYHAGTTEDDLLQETQMVDLRGKTSLIELAGVFKHAKVCISVDAGPMHIAVAVGCPTIALFGNDEAGYGASPVRLWAPRSPNVYRPFSTFHCQVCTEHRFKNEGCLLDDHSCMTHLRPEAVIEILQQLLLGS